MELRQLEYFRTVARHGNISRAAEELFVSQPSISKSIQNLEKELGTPLFDRKGKQIVLNSAGETALEYTNHVFTTLSAMKGALAHFSTIKNTMNLCTNMPFFLRYLTPLFSVEHPELLINALFIGEYELNSALLKEHAYDIILSNLPFQEPGIMNIHLMTDRPVLCVPKDSPLARRDSVTLQDLNGLSILVPETIRDGYHFRYIRDYLKKRKVSVNYLTQPDVGAARYLFSKLDACAMQSALTMAFHQYEDGIYIPIDDKDFAFPYYLSCLEDHPSYLDVFLQWIQNICAKLVP